MAYLDQESFLLSRLILFSLQVTSIFDAIEANLDFPFPIEIDY